MSNKGRGKVILRRCALGGAVACAWFLIHTVAIVVDGVRDEVRPADVMVVLGSKVEESGRPSQRLRDRLDRAVQLYHQGLAPTVIVSGGLGVEGHEEADVMASYLVARGVPDASVIRDRAGWNTYHTARNTRKIMDARGYRSALVVSSYFHLSRIKVAFGGFGIERVATARARMRIGLRDPWSLVREFGGYYVYLVRPYEEA